MSQDPRHRSEFGAGAGHGEPSLDPAGPRRDTVGRILRRAREREGLAIADVAEALRIRQDYLSAIERSEFERLPGATYAIGFVRSYAGFLELDDQEIVRRFKQEVAGLNRTQDLSFPEPVNEGKVPGRTLLIVSVLLIAAAYGGWSYVSSSGAPIRDMVPAVPDRLEAFLESGDGTTGEGGATPDDFASTTEGTGGAAAGEAPNADVGTDAGADRASSATEAADNPDETMTAGSSDSASVPAEETEAAGASEGPAAPDAGEAAPTPPSGSTGPDATPAPDAEPTTTTAEIEPPPETAPDGGGSTPSNAGGDASQSTSPTDTQTVSAPEAPATGGEAASANESASSEASAGSTETASPESDTAAATDATANDPEAGGSAQDGGATTGGIPEAPETGPDSAMDTETNTASTDSSGSAEGAETASLPEPPGGEADSASPDAGAVASAANGAQAEILGQAERIFGEANTESRLILRATQDSWVQVRGPDDGLLMTRVLNPGDVYRVPNRKGLVLHTGNAGGLRVYLDGNPLRRLGESGEVRRNVALSPEKLQ